MSPVYGCLLRRLSYTSAMKARTWAPRKLDIGAFIESGESLSGETAVADLVRLAEGLAQDADLAALPPVRWQAVGRTVPQRVGAPQRWLDLRAEGEFAWECQRCLHAVTLPVAIERSIRFVADEAAAAELDADSDDDVLAMARQFDLIELVEDELIMASPIVPRHDRCPTDVERHMRSEDDDGADAEESAESGERKNPFAVLAQLKKGGS